MKNGKCSKNYPKDFVEETEIPEDGFPKYRRRNNGHVAVVKNQQIDNHWMVHYNPYQVQKYNCHVNVEICSTVASVKYIHKRMLDPATSYLESITVVSMVAYPLNFDDDSFRLIFALQ